MTGQFLAALALVVAAFLGARIALARLPLARFARQLTVTDVVLIAAGLLGLAFHCGAMFYPQIAGAIPGTSAAIRQINAMDNVSKAWFVAAALLVLAGLRHQVVVAVCIVGVAFAAVGVTMFDGGSLSRHLTAILIAVVVLSGTITLLTSPPRRGDLTAESTP